MPKNLLKRPLIKPPLVDLLVVFDCHLHTYQAVTVVTTRKF